MGKIKSIYSKTRNRIGSFLRPVAKFLNDYFGWMRVLNPFRYIKRLDRYIISKFIGTYFFSIILVLSISIVFDVNEKLAKFSQYHAPFTEIVGDYYMNFVPYFANLFSPLFVFIAVIFFTSKLADNSEVISMLAAGVSKRRLLRPYFVSCIIISTLSYSLAAYVIPKGNIIKMDFESKYLNKKKNTAAENVQLFVEKGVDKGVEIGVVAYMRHYDNNYKRGFNFCLDKYEGKKIVSHMTAMEIQYDTISDSKYHWKATQWKIRDMRGLKEKVTSGMECDTTIMMEPMDLVFTTGQQETLTSPELKRYIEKQIDRGSGNVVQFEVEYHKRIASSFASFILAIIGMSLSAKKRKGGMGMALGAGLALSFTYIMLQTVSASFAINSNLPPMLAAWIPNLLFVIVAYLCYRHAPN